MIRREHRRAYLEARTNSSVTDRIDEAADHSVGSQSATETQEPNLLLADEPVALTRNQRRDRISYEPRDTPQEAAVQTRVRPQRRQ